MKRLSLVLLAAFLGSVTLLGCKPKAGGSCKTEMKESCIDEKKALACHDGKWEEMSCRGPAGCSKGAKDEICDQAVADKDDVCNLANDFVCTADKKGMLECQKNRWVASQSCLGERGCVLEKGKISCDNSVANIGDPCREEKAEEDYACTPDKKSALACRGGKFALASLCKGPKGCRIGGDKASGFKVECDDSLAAQGDSCEKDEHFACSEDAKTILKCKAKKWETEDKCKPREKCQIRGGQVGCY